MYKRTAYDINNHPDWVLDEAERFLQELSSDPKSLQVLEGIRGSGSVVNSVLVYLLRTSDSKSEGYNAWLYASVHSYTRLKKYLEKTGKTEKTIEQDGQIYKI